MNIEEQIIDIDGMCRDINFPDTDLLYVIAMIKYLEGFCELGSASDLEGNELTVGDIILKLTKSESETISSGWRCQGLISQIQLLLSWQNKSKVFIELTFFPEDIDSKTYSLESFKNWLKPFLVALNTKTFFVRHENVSWLYGDTSEFSGIIFTNSEHSING